MSAVRLINRRFLANCANLSRGIGKVSEDSEPQARHMDCCEAAPVEGAAGHTTMLMYSPCRAFDRETAKSLGLNNAEIPAKKIGLGKGRMRRHEKIK
jgi:hypothetical protein